MSRVMAGGLRKQVSVRTRHLALGVMLGLGLVSCASDDEALEPVQESTEYGANEAALPPDEYNNDSGPVDAEFANDGEKFGTGDSELAATPEPMFSEPTPPPTGFEAPGESAFEPAPLAIPEAPLAMPAASGTIKSPGAVWQPGDVQPTGSSAAGASAPSISGEATSYVIAAGDTLRGISRKLYGTTARWNEIAAMNSLSEPYLIFAGASLKVPAGGKVTTASVPAKSSGKVSPSPSVTVKPGDTLWKLAYQQFGDHYAWPRFLQYNSGVLTNPDKLEVGMVLSCVPNGTAAAAPPPAPKAQANTAKPQAAKLPPPPSDNAAKPAEVAKKSEPPINAAKAPSPPPEPTMSDLPMEDVYEEEAE